MLARLRLLVCIFCAAIPQIVAPPPCSFTLEGASYDLSPLTKTAGPDYQGNDDFFTYRMNVCGSTLQGGRCAGTAVCAFWKDDMQFHGSYGSWLGTPEPTWGLADTTNPSLGAVLSFKNGQSACAGKTETANIVLLCDPTVTTDQPFAVNEDFTTCTLTVTMRHAKACPTGGGDDDGLSGGSIFLILLLVFFVLYIVGGMIYKSKRLGATGADTCPNVEFWRALPGLVTDGCKFTWHKLRNVTNRSSAASQYDKL